MPVMNSVCFRKSAVFVFSAGEIHADRVEITHNSANAREISFLNDISFPPLDHFILSAHILLGTNRSFGV